MLHLGGQAAWYNVRLTVLPPDWRASLNLVFELAVHVPAAQRHDTVHVVGWRADVRPRRDGGDAWQDQHRARSGHQR